MNAVLGGGPTGRLFTHLREEKGYTYGAYSNISAGQFRGSWTASTDVRTEVTEPALRDLVAEITRMRNEPVPTKEFEDRKRGMVASFALSLESPAAVLNNHVTRWLYKLPADYWDKYPGSRHGRHRGRRPGRGEEVPRSRRACRSSPSAIRRRSRRSSRSSARSRRLTPMGR